MRPVARIFCTAATLAVLVPFGAKPVAAQATETELAALFPPLPWDAAARIALPTRVLAIWQQGTGVGCVSIIFSQYPCAAAWSLGVGPNFSEEWREEFIQQTGPNRRFANQSTAPRTGMAGEHLGAAPSGETLLGRTRQERRSPRLRW